MPLGGSVDESITEQIAAAIDGMEAGDSGEEGAAGLDFPEAFAACRGFGQAPGLGAESD